MADEKQAKSESNESVVGLSEIGVTGLRFAAGEVQEELNHILRGERATRIFQEMADNDPVIGSMLFAIDMLIRQVDWTVEPHPEGSDEDVEFLQGCMEDMNHSWQDFISEVLTMLPYGFSFFEIVYKRRGGYQDDKSKTPTSDYDDNKIGWHKFGVRAQSSLVRWEFTDTGIPTGFYQRAAPNYQEVLIPFDKGLLFRTTTSKGNPEGRSILRSAYRPWYFKKRMEEIEGVGIERDLAGLPMAKVDASILTSTSTADRNLVASIRTTIKNVRQDKEAGIIWPTIVDREGRDLLTFELLSSGGTRSFDISNVIQRYDSRIAMTVLADFVLLGHQGGGATGSWALSSDKTTLFAQAIGAWLGVIEDVLNRFAVQRLWRVNGMDPALAPKIVHKDIEKPDLAQLGAFLQQLATMGMPLFPDEDLEKHLRELADIPQMSDEARDAMEQAQQEGGESGQLMQQYAQRAEQQGYQDGLSGEDEEEEPDEETDEEEEDENE